MEELILKEISQEIEFENEKLQIELKSFSNFIKSKETDLLYFLSHLFDLQNAWSKNNIAWFIQKTKDGCKYVFYDFMKNNFGLEANYIQRCIKVYKRFTTCDVAGFNRHFEYEGYSLSKYFILLSLSVDQIRYAINTNCISPYKTCKELKEYVRSIKGIKDNKVLEDIYDEDNFSSVISFDKNKVYTLDFFNSLPREQLINVAWELYNEYQKKG